MISPSDDFVTFSGNAKGEGHTLQEAIEDAYEKGKGGGHRCFRVVEIQFCGDNPINDYKVIVTPL